VRHTDFAKGSLQSLDWTGGLDWWTGPVDWTGGLTFFALLFSQNRLTCNALHSCMMRYNNPKTQPSISLNGLRASN